MSNEDAATLIKLGLWITFVAFAWRIGTERGRTGWAWRIFQVWLSVPAVVTMYLLRDKRLTPALELELRELQGLNGPGAQAVAIRQARVDKS
jgi:hypothetical protein